VIDGVIWQEQIPEKPVITQHINHINDPDRRYRYHFSYKFAKKGNRRKDSFHDNIKNNMAENDCSGDVL